MTDYQNEVLEFFGEKLIEAARDRTLLEEFKTIDGLSKAPASKRLYEKLKGFSDKQREIIKEIVIDSVDGALNNFLWLIEQEDRIDLVSYQDDNNEIYSLAEISDGLSVDYWNFVDDFSKYKRIS